MNEQQRMLLEILATPKIDPWTEHQRIVRRRTSLPEAEIWILREEAFRSWYDIRSTSTTANVLFCHGIPGAGKSFIL